MSRHPLYRSPIGCFAAALLAIGMMAGSSTRADEMASRERFPVQQHRVQPGETLWDITQRYRGEALEWPLLQQANQVSEPTQLQVGDLLEVPLLTAEVSHRQGTVWLIRQDGRRAPLREGMALSPGDRVETMRDAYVTLHLPHGQDVVLPSSTRVILKQQAYHFSRLYLERGELEARVPARDDHQEALQIETPTDIIGVRGTHFHVKQADGNMRVSTLEGEVAVRQGSNKTGNTEIMVPAGRGVLSAVGAPYQLTRLLPPPRFGEQSHAFSPRLGLTLSEVNDAVAYRVQLSQDPQFQTIFRDRKHASRSFTFKSLPRGFYYARSSATDRMGIEGEYQRKLILHRPVTASLEVDGRHYRFRWNDDSSLTYRLELSRDSGFQAPFMSRVYTRAGGVILNNLPTADFFWRLQVLPPGDKTTPATVASGRQRAQHQQ